MATSQPTDSQYEKVLLSKIDGILTCIERVETKVDKLQEEQHVLSAKIVALETWKQASRVEEKLQSFSVFQNDVIRLQEQMREALSFGKSLKEVEDFKNRAAGYGAAILIVITIVTQVLTKLLVR